MSHPGSQAVVNNFEQISGLLKFDSPDDFYFVQILQRNKEHPHLGSNNRRLREYYIHSTVQLAGEMFEMIEMCNLFTARAYIHPNRRNRRQLALEMLALLAQNIKSHQYEGISRIYESMCGKHHSEKDKLWVVDVDSKSEDLKDSVQIAIECIRREGREPEGIHTYNWIPTKNGFHLITEGFNSLEFSNWFKKETARASPHEGALIEIHKNNPTMLYCP